MKTESRSKWLVLIVFILIITNAVSLFFLLNNRKQDSRGEHRRSAIKNFLKNDVGFSEAQLTAFDSMSQSHRNSIRPLYDGLAKKRESILGEAAHQNFQDSSIRIAAKEISESQVTFEEGMLNHLREIRSICTPDQLPRFDSGFYKLITRRRSSTSQKK